MSFDPGATLIFREKKYRFRFSLPTELLLFGFLLILAVAGGFLPGALHDMLVLRGDNLPWFFTVAGVAIAGLLLVGAEICCGGAWRCELVANVALGRMWLNVLAVAVWLYMVHTVIALRDPFGASSLVLIGALCCCFHGWAAVQCKRLHVLLNPRFRTSQLEARLASSRVPN